MPIGEPQLSTASMLVQRLLWNRTKGGLPRPLPVVVLLGPVGAGKTHALKSISQACDAGVVHALFDFDRSAPATTVEVLAHVAFDLSRKWQARPEAQFTRFTLGMIAVQTPLGGLTRGQAKDKLRAAIDDFARHPGAESVTAKVRGLADAARDAGIIDARLAETIKAVLPLLIQTVARRPLSRAKSWHADIPEAESASPLDALVSLNRRAGDHPNEITTWLSAAFLADVRDSYLRMAPPDSRSPCTCNNPEKKRHWHNWVLLLDNLDHEGGERFVTDLTAARERHLHQYPDDHDPILVIATSGRWSRGWESAWRPPWQAASTEPDRVRTVPRCRAARYEHWIGKPAFEQPPFRYYPVLLEPLNIEETAKILGISKYVPECILAQRATGGLPSAVHSVAPLLLRDQNYQPGTRNVLEPSNPATTDIDLWRGRLDSVRLVRHLPDIGIDGFVSAAPFATAPWLVPAEATSVISRPQVGRILTELRTALWVTAPARGGGTPDYAELHPWIARALVSALARRKPGPDHHPSYTAQFEALLEDPDTLRDPARKAYCHLALKRITEVINAFEDSFDREPHRDWINRLKLVARAPDNLPPDHSCAELYQELVNDDIDNRPQGRSPVGNVVTRLVAASWLAANPFAMPDPALRDIIVNSYGELPPLSRRADVGELHDAERLASEPLL